MKTKIKRTLLMASIVLFSLTQTYAQTPKTNESANAIEIKSKTKEVENVKKASLISSDQLSNNLKEMEELYYSNSSIKFCTDVDDNYNAIGASEVFNISPSLGGYAYILIKNNNKVFKTEKLHVKIYRGLDLSELIETKTFNVNPLSSNFKFPYTFRKSGKYIFLVFNDENTLIKTGQLDIRYN